MVFDLRHRLEELTARQLNLVTLLAGAVVTLTGLLVSGDWRTVLISIGASVIASAVVVWLSSRYLFIESRTKEIIDAWRLNAIYRTRAEMNLRADACLASCDTRLDIAAFGLKSFRDTQSNLIRNRLKRGIRLRILAPDPASVFVAQRERDEKEVGGQIRNTICQLIEWCNELRSCAPQPENVQVRLYDALPVDFYFRVDDTVFLGPYMHGRSSQQSFSMEFLPGGIGFEYWSKYFEELWDTLGKGSRDSPNAGGQP